MGNCDIATISVNFIIFGGRTAVLQMDAKDILGLPKNALPIQEKKLKPPKESQRKPDGISREVLRTLIFWGTSNLLKLLGCV